MHTIAVDAMGGDHAPGPEVAGAVAAVREADLVVILVGDEQRLRRALARLGARVGERLQVCHASDVVAMDDDPSRAFRQKHDSSMRVAFDLVVDGEADAVVSAGNSGAMLSHSLFLLKRLEGAERPAIAGLMPTLRGNMVMCDLGANVEVKPSMLAQFGVMGACFDRVLHRTARPRVGLLANGHEETKGTELTRAAHRLLRAAARHEQARFDFAGYVEGSEIFDGACDVVATDGWTGNVALKISEGVSTALFHMMRDQFSGSLRDRVAGALARPALEDLKRSVHYSETGGALLLGVRGLVMICHGKSEALALTNAIKTSDEFLRDRLLAELSETLALHQRLWERDDAA